MPRIEKIITNSKTVNTKTLFHSIIAIYKNLNKIHIGIVEDRSGKIPTDRQLVYISSDTKEIVNITT